MALKFLNKKGWHTGSLRNIENVWKAEQKHDAEQRKLEELRKQIHEERERAEFRQLQEQAGLVPRQERLEFLYESGLAVGKGSGSSFQELDSLPKTAPETNASSSAAAATTAAKPQQATPGALFEESKPQSANDAWRKLHSDPLLLIRQREQEALARVKNNPVQMAMIRKSVESKKEKKMKKHSSKKHAKKSKHRKHSSSENESDSEGTGVPVEKQKEIRQRGSRSENHLHKEVQTSDEESHRGDTRRKKYNDKEYTDRSSKHEEADGDQQTKRRRYDTNSREYSSGRHVESRNDKYEESDDDRMRRRSRYDTKIREPSPERHPESRNNKHEESDDDRIRRKSHYDTKSREYRPERHAESRNNKHEESDGDRMRRKSRYDSKSREHSLERPLESRNDKPNPISSSDKPPRSGPNIRARNPVKFSEEERAAKFREMQMDAEKHEEQRWKRLKKAEDTDAQEAVRDKASLGRNFLDSAHKSVYGAEKGGSSTIEESVRRRTHYLQRSATDTNAFRR